MGFGDWIKDIVSAPVEDEYENEQVETQETVEEEKPVANYRPRIFPVREQEQSTQAKAASKLF